MSLENAHPWVKYEIRSMIGQRVGGDIRLSANFKFIFVLYLVVDLEYAYTRHSAVETKVFVIRKRKASENTYDNIKLLDKM